MQINDMPDELLRLAILDCMEAISANPAHEKAIGFLRLAKDCSEEVNRRFFAEAERLIRAARERDARDGARFEKMMAASTNN